MVTKEVFFKELQKICGRKLHVRINDNHSTMVSVKWDANQTKVSLHRMFLDAPQNIMESLACYIIGKDKVVSPQIREFIDAYIRNYNYSHVLKKKDLQPAGEVYHLQQIFDFLKREYFDDSFDLQITWYGQGNRRYRSRINFGLYFDALELIKVHRILDHASVPDYVVHFVVYHEMLHHLYPPAKGVVHTDEFRRCEKLFREYEAANFWFEENKRKFFV